MKQTIFYGLLIYIAVSFFIGMMRSMPERKSDGTYNMQCQHLYADYVFPLSLVFCEVRK